MDYQRVDKISKNVISSSIMFDFANDKRGTILQAGLTVFLNYGFRKTSMDDIAREAGMSRPALYQLFKNKTDIFRALSEILMHNALDATGQAFQKGGSLRDKLFASIDDSIMTMHRFTSSSPHGVELIGVNQEIARDIEFKWKNEMIKVIAAGLDECVEAKMASLKKVDSTAVARIIMHSMEGMRETYLSGESIDDYVDELIDFVALAIAPEKTPALA